MKKFGKFLFGTATLAALGAGAYYAYKKFVDNNGRQCLLGLCQDDVDECGDITHIHTTVAVHIGARLIHGL